MMFCVIQEVMVKHPPQQANNYVEAHRKSLATYSGRLLKQGSTVNLLDTRIKH